MNMISLKDKSNHNQSKCQSSDGWSNDHQQCIHRQSYSHQPFEPSGGPPDDHQPFSTPYENMQPFMDHLITINHLVGHPTTIHEPSYNLSPSGGPSNGF